MAYASPREIKEYLLKSCAPLGEYKDCIFLDYPSHMNVGDNMIWLGEIFLLNFLNIKISHIASEETFSECAVKKYGKRIPIFLHGGGNFGDMWGNFQAFRECIIKRYKDRPIVIFPQTIYYRDQANLENSAKILNSHPDLTIFTRDNQSHELALEYFNRCKIIKAPDMAFALIDLPVPNFYPKSKDEVLYLSRLDIEKNRIFSPQKIHLQNLAINDWCSYKWRIENYFCIRGSGRFVREIWQRGIAHPVEYISRVLFHLRNYPIGIQLKGHYPLFRRSLGMMHSAMFQFKRFRAIITDRLHGHILCLIMGIPHVFLPNAYYKNEAFYNTWTRDISFCRFVKEENNIANTIEGLKNVKG